MVILFNHVRNPIDLRASFLAFFFQQRAIQKLDIADHLQFFPTISFHLKYGPFHMGYIPSLSHFKSAPQLFWPLDMSKGAKGAALRAHPAGKKRRSPHIIHVSRVFPHIQSILGIPQKPIWFSFCRFSRKKTTRFRKMFRLTLRCRSFFLPIKREFDIFGKQSIGWKSQKPGLNSWIHGLFA